MRLGVDCTSITPGRSAGVENFTYGLLNGLATLHSVEQIIVHVAFGTRASWAEQLQKHPTITIEELGRSSSLALARLTTMMRLSRGNALAARAIHALERGAKDALLLRRSETDIVYFPFHRTVLCGRSSVVTAHDLRVFQPEFYDSVEARQIEINLERARAVVTSWPHPYRQLAERFPPVRQKLFCIPLPLLVNTVVPPEAEQGRDRSAPKGRKILLYPAATARHKNHLNLIRAVASLVGTYDIGLVCTGPLVSPVYEEVRDEISSLGLQDRVEFPGFVDESQLQALYREADVIVVPSRWEAASGPVFEAFARHKPVACSDIGPIRAQVEFAGGAASFFDPVDPNDIAAAVSRILEDPSEFIAGSRRASGFVSRMTWARCAQDYAQVFEWVAGGGVSPRPALSYEPEMTPPPS